MGKFLGMLYYCFRWWAGAALTDDELEVMKGKGDAFTYWFQRHKKRIGWFFWVEVTGYFGFGIWLVLHIIGVC